MKNYISEYEQQAFDFLKMCKATMEIEFVGIAVNKNWDNQKRNLYSVTIITPKGSYTFDFWDSIRNKEKGLKPTEYDVLACLTKYDVGTFEEFCWSFGYDTDSRKALDIYLAVQNEYSNLCRIFTPNQMEEMQEIQ